jgi:LmbE family N-acetylglucosaminyl deacetylase
MTQHTIARKRVTMADSRVDRPRVVESPGTGSIMAVAAHPDDIERWCAGTLAHAIDMGATVRLLLVTSGEAGSSDPHATRERVSAQREREAERAAHRLGIAELTFLREPDGAVENTASLRKALVRWIRSWRPTVVFTFDPEYPDPPHLSHRDHRMVGRAALDAVYPLARDRLAFPELEADGLPPHAVETVWLFASTRATAYVDIGSTFDRKLAARLAHESQTVDPVTLAQRWRVSAAMTGAPVKLAAAEAFTVLSLA